MESECSMLDTRFSWKSGAMKKFSAYGLKETDLGNHVLLQLRNLTQEQMVKIRKDLKIISNEVGREFYEDKPYLYFLP